MQPYELTLILKPGMDEEAVDSFVKKLPITVSGTQNLGKRLLSYPIKKQKEGNYILFDIKADTKKMRELDQALRISDSVLRYLLIAKED